MTLRSTPCLALALSVVLVGCTPHAVLAPLPEDADARTVAPVFTATNRQGPRGEDSATRSEALTFNRFDIAIPPKRSAGQVTYPRGTVDPNTDFLVARATRFASKRQFRAALSRELRTLPRAERDVVIYVHGFNNKFADGVLRHAQLTHDFALKGASVHFSWPSAANPLGYAYDQDSAMFSRDALEEVLDLVRVPEARRIAIVAHSMGAMLTMETLRQMAIARPGSVARDIDGVLLISPDLDVDLFRSQARRIGKLPDTFAVFLSERDRALNLSARLTGTPERLGSLREPSRIAEFEVTLVDVSEFSSGVGHFSTASSAPLISILSAAAEVDNAFASDVSGRSGLLPGSVITVQNVTEFVLTAGSATP
ncbi:MAG: alpha/beta fold hydrolase [Pseudomonadota bacterium]